MKRANNAFSWVLDDTRWLVYLRRRWRETGLAGYLHEVFATRQMRRRAYARCMEGF